VANSIAVNKFYQHPGRNSVVAGDLDARDGRDARPPSSATTSSVRPETEPGL
jgi:hypothetical protein